MTPEEIRQLRQELQCTARELAETLNLDPAEVTAWEQGDRFATKKMVAAMNQLRQKGPAAIVRNRKRRDKSASSVHRLADPDFWQLVRKLIEHPDLFTQVKSLADSYPDPISTSTSKL